MSYTKEEVAKIKAGLKQIEDYAKAHYVPRLPAGESVNVEFGDPDPRRWNYSMEKDLSFGVNSDGEIWFRAGGLALFFHPPEWQADRDIYSSWPYTVELLHRWPEVKRKMEAAISEKESKRRAVLSFSVDGESAANVVKPQVVSLSEISSTPDTIQIFWNDLTEAKQKEILSALGDNGNYDMIPIAEIPVSDENNLDFPENGEPFKDSMRGKANHGKNHNSQGKRRGNER